MGNPLIFWYQWDYLRSPAKIFFCRVSKTKIGSGFPPQKNGEISQGISRVNVRGAREGRSMGCRDHRRLQAATAAGWELQDVAKWIFSCSIATRDILNG